MKPENIVLLCSPSTHEPLKMIEEKSGGQVKQKLVTAQMGQEFLVVGGIPVFVPEEEQALKERGHNFYNFIAPLYDILHSVPSYRFGGEQKIREEYLKELEIKENDRVLEVAVGTGANLRYLPKNAQYYGVDISPGMLNQCQKTLRSQGLEAELLLADAEKLPFRENIFDAVLNVCSLRLIKDKARALNEMVRVAKPGARIVIVDQKRTGVPAQLIPAKMLKVRLKDIPYWQLCCLTFVKP